MGWTAEPTGVFEQTAPWQNERFLNGVNVDGKRWTDSGPKKSKIAAVGHFTGHFGQAMHSRGLER